MQWAVNAFLALLISELVFNLNDNQLFRQTKNVGGMLPLLFHQLILKLNDRITITDNESV